LHLICLRQVTTNVQKHNHGTSTISLCDKLQTNLEQTDFFL